MTAAANSSLNMHHFDTKLKNLKKMYNNNIQKGSDYIETT